MAAAEPTGLTFVDEDDLPVAFLRIAHVDSDNEAPSDTDSSEEGESAATVRRPLPSCIATRLVEFHEELLGYVDEVQSVPAFDDDG